MKKKFEFKDATGAKVKVKLKIEDGEFTMSGQYRGSSGQCFSDVDPEGDDQATLLEYWDKYHLNKTKPGTRVQMDLVKDIPGFVEKKEELFKKGKLTALDKDGFVKPYGSVWFKHPLPENFEQTVEHLVARIEAEFDAEEIICWDDLEEQLADSIIEKAMEEHGFEDKDMVIAICEMWDLSEESLLADVEWDGDNRITVEGTDYYFGTDDEMTIVWEEYLQNYIDEHVMDQINESYHFAVDNDALISHFKTDGRGHSLNSYDGGELNHGDYYAYQN